LTKHIPCFVAVVIGTMQVSLYVWNAFIFIFRSFIFCDRVTDLTLLQVWYISPIGTILTNSVVEIAKYSKQSKLRKVKNQHAEYVSSSLTKHKTKTQLTSY
jgi:hypothetical protein